MQEECAHTERAGRGSETVNGPKRRLVWELLGVASLVSSQRSDLLIVRLMWLYLQRSGSSVSPLRTTKYTNHNRHPFNRMTDCKNVHAQPNVNREHGCSAQLLDWARYCLCVLRHQFMPWLDYEDTRAHHQQHATCLKLALPPGYFRTFNEPTRAEYE